MSKPFEPRRSLLAGQHPVSLPREDTQPALPATPVPPAKSTSPAKRKLTIYLPTELDEKLRGAFRVYGMPTGVLSLSAWITPILQAEIDRIEAESGSVPRLAPGNIPQGWNAR